MKLQDELELRRQQAELTAGKNVANRDVHDALIQNGFRHAGNDFLKTGNKTKTISKYSHPEGGTATVHEDGTWHTQRPGTQGPYGTQVPGPMGGRTAGMGAREMHQHLSGAKPKQPPSGPFFK